MSLPPDDRAAARRRPRADSGGGPAGSASSSARPSSRPRTEAVENAVALPRSVSPSPGWQLPAAHSCDKCFQLSCTCCSVRVDPVQKRQRLDTLRLNTPYERLKLARSTDELLNEEKRQRERLMNQREMQLEPLRTVELLGRRGVHVITQEAHARDRIQAAEAEQWAACISAASHRSVVVALQLAESAARQTIVALQDTARDRIGWQCNQSKLMVQLGEREAKTRVALWYNEWAGFELLQKAEVKGRAEIEAKMRARVQFGVSVSETCDAIAHEWKAGVEALAAAAAAHRELIAQHVRDRQSFLQAVEQGKRDVAVEEEAARLRVHNEMVEEADWVVERLRTFARQRGTLLETEAARRRRIYEEAESGYHVIFVDMKADEDDVYAAEAQRAEQQRGALLFALEALSAIQYEEHAAFTALLERQRADAAGRREWRAQQAATRVAFAERCLREAAMVVPAEEGAARAALRKQFAADEVAVAELVAAKARVRAALTGGAFAALAAVVSEERDARFRLAADMAAHEERVLQWCKEKQRALVAIQQQEEAQRTAFVQQESWCRQALASASATTAKALADRLILHRQARARVVAAAEAALTQVAEEERWEWEQLCACSIDDRRRAHDLHFFRRQAALLDRETQHRLRVTQAEVAARAEVRTMMAIAARSAAEAARAALRVQLSAVAAAENSAREVFYSGVGEWYDAVAAQQRHEELQLIIDLERRISAELRSRQTAMTEDTRLYTEEEPLESTSPTHCIAHRDRMADGEDEGGMRGLRHALVLQQLGNPSCSTALSATAVDFLVAVIDHAERRRSAAQEIFDSAERRARDAGKRLAQCEDIYASEKEKKSMYEVSSQREAQERARRLQGEAQDKARNQQSVAAEKRRLAEVEAALGEQRRQLDVLKLSINKQYRR